MQQKKLIVGITEHQVLGLLFIPYIVIIKPNHGFYPIEVKISQHNVSKYIAGFTENEKQLVKWMDEYSDQNLQKIFSKKKGQTVVEFINSLKKDYADQYIRPYIEKRLVKCTDLIEQIDIDVYYKEKPRYVSVDDKIEVQRGRAQSVFNIRKLENQSQYFLSIQHDKKELNLLNKTYRVISDDPCRIIIDNKLYIIDDINARKLSPFFNKDCILIPKSSEKKWFETFALDAVKQFNVKPLGFKIVDKEADKKAVLCLEKSLSGNLILELTFIYNNSIKVYANRGESAFVKLEMLNEDYTFYKINRIKQWEESLINQIKNLGLELQNNCQFYLKEPKEDKSADFDIIKWISGNKKSIEDLGIEIRQNFSDLKYSFEIPQISSSVKEETDWFDIYISVKIGEFEIPFIRFRKNILNGNREYKLPNGDIFILPLEWFEEYKELFQFGKDSANHLQIEKHHFGILENTTFEKNISIFEKYNKLVSGYHNLNYKLPEGLNAELRPYQKEGFGWMNLLQESMFGGCLADDMGLGKTVQTLTLLLSSKGKDNGEKYQPIQKPVFTQLSIFDSLQQVNAPASATSLIIMPTSLIHNWESEIKKFTPALKCFKHIGQSRPKDISIFNEFDIILTTYGTVRNDFELLREYKFFYIILDESQYIKNPDSKIYKAVNQLRSKHRLVLTGTPIENSLTDLWAQINFLNKGLLGNLSFFKREFVNPIEKNIDPKKKERLQQFIQPFVLRRTKQQVAKDLPDKLETVIYCDMTDEQKSY
ncbi:MAG TPA: SNF2-related protein, partial [Bacteroidales bacterium]|nr:SNF2-related protein [Bacteroidales bacterium]